MPSSSNRFDIGPALLAIGALVLLASLFLEWYEPDLSAWNTFEWLDLLLAGLGLLVLFAGIGLLSPGWSAFDAERVPLLVAAALAVVAVQLLDPPPVAAGEAPGTGAWLALAGCGVMALGTVLTFGRMHLQVSFEGRDPRRRVSAVDARRGAGAGSGESPGLFDVEAPAGAGTGAGPEAADVPRRRRRTRVASEPDEAAAGGESAPDPGGTPSRRSRGATPAPEVPPGGPTPDPGDTPSRRSRGAAPAPDPGGAPPHGSEPALGAGPAGGVPDEGAPGARPAGEEPPDPGTGEARPRRS